jgi:hypothetical protein
VKKLVGDLFKRTLRTEAVLRERLMEVAAGTEPIKPLVGFVHPNAELEVKKSAIPVVRE